MRGLQNQGITLRNGGGRLTIDPRRARRRDGARGRAGAAIEPLDRQPYSVFYTWGRCVPMFRNIWKANYEIR